jgi:7-cyano-7-deazaguanine synthase
MSAHKKAVVLLSGGMDSATVLASAIATGYDAYCLSIDYGQRHGTELDAARELAAGLGAKGHKTVPLDLRVFGGSALTDDSIAVPTSGVPAAIDASQIPLTYVPARNTIFLSLALAYAEVLGADDIFIGANAVDYSGYPDCRPEYINAYERMANLATKRAVEGQELRIHTPIINLSKADIVRRGHELGVDFALTVSCYKADGLGQACGECDACRLRRKGFEEAGISDSTRYAKGNPG